MKQASRSPLTTQTSTPWVLPKYKTLIALWLRNHKTRKSLEDMERHRLRDIGVAQAEAIEEGRKPFWR